MPKRPTPKDLDEYLPDAAAAAAIMAGPAEYNEVDPELVEKLRRLGTNPDLMRVAPPSVKAHVGPTEIPGAGVDRKSVPRTQAKVELALPPSRGEMPTTLALKRLQGEPDVPGVVKGPSRVAPSGKRGAEPGTAHGRTSLRVATVAVLAIFIPVFVVIFVMARVTREERNGAAPSVASGGAAVRPSALPAPPVSAPPTAASSSAPAPTVSAPVAVPTPTPTSAAPPAPSLPKQQRRDVLDDPYDAPPRATSAPSATVGAAPTPAPTAPPSETMRPAPTPAPSTSALAPWFTP